MAYVDWRMRGPEIATCNCDWGCPCQFNARPTHGDCRGMVAMRIDEGHFGNVNLSRVRWCSMIAWPKAVHEGNGEALTIIDAEATEAQRDAVLAILSGQETEPGATIFNVFAAMLTKVHDPIYARIEFDVDIDRRIGRVRVAGVMDTKVEPIRNPVTGDEHRVRVILPNGFEFGEAEFASGTTLASDPVKLAYSNAYAHIAMLDLCTRGRAGA